MGEPAARHAVYLCVWMLAAAFYTLQSFTMAGFAERLNLPLRNSSRRR